MKYFCDVKVRVTIQLVISARLWYNRVILTTKGLHMFILPPLVLSSTSLSSSTKLVYAYIAGLCKDTPQISYDKIAVATGITKMSAIRCTQHLIDSGLLERTKDSKGWLHYSVL